MHTQESTCTHSFLQAHAGPISRTHGEFQKPKQDKFYVFMFEVWNESHIVWESF